jgi:HK97 family phage prohead protease
VIVVDTSLHDKMMKRYGRYIGRPPERAEESDDDEPRLCIEGIAVLTDEPIGLKTGEIIVIEKGAFDAHLSSGARTEMWLAHDPKEVIGSTTSGMEFAKTNNGLAFRFPLTNKRYAATIERMVTSGIQAAISVGITHTKARQETIGRHKVTFIEVAELRECSLVEAGACEQAFARLIDANCSPPLRESINSTPFRIESGIHTVKVKAEKQAAQIEAMKTRTALLEQRARK